MLKMFPEIKEREEMRKIIGRYGLTGRQQVGKIYADRINIMLIHFFYLRFARFVNFLTVKDVV